MLCSTCHDDAAEFAVYAVEQVSFPSGAQLTMEEPASNLCLECHQGRESTVSVNEATAGLDADAVAEELGFLNVHYFAAGATVLGTEAKGAYEYDGQSYVGRMSHPGNYNDCTECHTPHGLEVEFAICGRCHEGIETREDLTSIRESAADYDGDGNADEGIHDEITTLYGALYDALQTYAAEEVGTPIVYDSHAYPYFFVDTNGNGEADPDEANYGNSYATWTPRLLRAAYNYQYTSKDPGAYSHNPLYIIQVLYDALSDMGTQVELDMTGMVRPGSE
jgi:Zn finger protein HypA/HybF involved in hydrogenase expression